MAAENDHDLTEDEIHLLELRNIRMHRLRLLQRRQAIEGPRTPPEILIEIEDTMRELGLAEKAVAGYRPDYKGNDIIEDLGPTGRFWAQHAEIKLVQDRLELLGAELGGLQERMAEVGALQAQLGPLQAQLGQAQQQLAALPPLQAQLGQISDLISDLGAQLGERITGVEEASRDWRQIIWAILRWLAIGFSILAIGLFYVLFRLWGIGLAAGAARLLGLQ